ncbi:MAG: hypothetical protein J5760_04230 [Clostridia bacterium]|nr:hypothetical protein [Clostridia bacterium]
MSLLDYRFYSEARGAEYEIMLEAWGEGVLAESQLLDMQKPDEILRRFKHKYRRAPKSVSLLLNDPRLSGCDYCYTGIDPALLEKFAALKELVLPDSITGLEITPAVEKILKENDTLIRGSFDSYAERFAQERGLRFRPADLIFAEYYFEPAQESTRLTLVFGRGGNVFIKEDVSSPGTSSSNTFGGTFIHPLKKEFYKESTAEEIAQTLGGRLAEAVISDGRLAGFIKKAQTHEFFKGKA